MTIAAQPPGWDEQWQKEFTALVRKLKKQDLTFGRVSLVYNDFYRILTTGGERLCKVAGRMKLRSRRADLPAVGDWVAFEDGKELIQAVLPRRTKFSRKISGRHLVEQVVAANIDLLFVVTSCNSEFNMRRLERYALLAAEGGITPVLLLSKADLCPDGLADEYIEQARTLFADIIVTSAQDEFGVDAVAAKLHSGITAAMVGSSGVGKSTLINLLCGSERQKTGAIRAADERGRHSTTRRELIVLLSGAVIIDTPGMRELQLWGDGAGLADAFEDVREFAAGCRFGDCSHENEPGCAVLEAVESGRLDLERYRGFVKLNSEQRELKKARKIKK